jgi:hypothetical protein
MSSASPERIQAFITEWEVSGGAERGNAHSFLNELCDILEVPRPHKTVPDSAQNAYVFEKTIPAPEGSKNFIDLYKRGCFVLETKQGADGCTDAERAAQLAKKNRKMVTAFAVRQAGRGHAESAREGSTYVRRLPRRCPMVARPSW